jgi:hypothetical protein
MTKMRIISLATIMTVDRSGADYTEIHYVVVSAPMDEQGAGTLAIP